MDFLTRLAQRMTGDLPLVQPRLPSLFESAAGAARPTTALQELGIVASPDPTETTPAARPAARRAPRAVTIPTPRDAAPDVEPLRPPVSSGERVRSAPALAPDQAEGAPGSLQNEDPARASVPSAPDHTPRLAVPVVTRRAAVSAAPALASAGSRQGISAAQASDGVQPEHANAASANLMGPPTVHVHIGRIDVRAVTTAPASPPRQTPRPIPPRTSLEDYLNGRKGGSQP